MPHRLRFVLLALAAMLAAGVAVAEPLGSHWEFTPFGGYTIFDGKMRFPGSNLPVTDDLHVGGRLAWQSPSWVALEAASGFSSTAEDIPGVIMMRDVQPKHRASPPWHAKQRRGAALAAPRTSPIACAKFP